VRTQEVFREIPIVTQFAFRRLLEWLDDGVESHGERYLEMRRRLVAYFERRNRPDPEALTDETLNRVGRMLEEQGTIHARPPARYCYVVARFVLLEDIRYRNRHVDFHETAASLRVAALSPDWRGAPDAKTVYERRMDCLDRCLEELKPEQRELIVDYYRDTRRDKIDRRRGLAARLGITKNALGIRVLRIRDALLACIEARERFSLPASYR
jgi:DNA-directed RNA polymerase specialized sigma24 family protein